MLLRIQKGLKKHHNANDTFLSATLYPPLSSGKIRLWVDADSGSFNQLDFQKPKEVRGSYWIEGSSKDYRAVGVIDADADGTYATYIATPQTQPTALTPAEVY